MASDHYKTDADSLAFPRNTVVGIVDDPGAVASVIRQLVESGVPEERIDILCGEAGARRLDPEGERHGLLERLRRLVQHYGDEEIPHVHRQAEELRAGNFVVAVPAQAEEQRDAVAEVLRANGAYFINHYGDWTVTRLEE